MAKDKFIAVFMCRFAAAPESFHPHQTIFNGRGIRFVRMTCGASLHTGLILSALEEGAEGIVLLTCPVGQCHFSEGAAWAARVEAKSSQLLRILGFTPDRVRHVQGKAGEAVFEQIRSFASSLGVQIGSKVSFPAVNGGKEPERIKS